MTVSRTDRVLDLEGLNEDGEDLIEGYSYKGKDRETAANELVERAIDMGYLADGETVSITVSSADADWQAREEAQIQAQLEERYGETIVIQLGSEPIPSVTPPPDGSAGDRDPGGAAAPPREQTPTMTIQITAPMLTGSPTITTPTTVPAPTGSPTTPTRTTAPTADGVTDYADTDYGPYADGVTDYEDTDDGNADDDGDRQ